MNVTPPIFEAPNAHGASPALPENLSLADLLFADSPANGASNFRAIAATLFGVENSTETQSPTNFAINEKKSSAGVSADKPDTRKLKESSDPASSGVNAELLVPLENIPAPPIQVSAKPDTADDRQLNSSSTAGSSAGLSAGLSVGSTQPNQLALPGPAQINNVSSVANLAAATPDDRTLPTAFGAKGTPMIQPTTENAPRSGKHVATPISMPENGIAPKKALEPAESPVNYSQPPIVPQDSKQSAPPLVSTDRAIQSIHSNFSGGPDTPPVAINALPATPPVEQPLDAPANQALDSVVGTNAVPQSGLVNSGTGPGFGNTSGRNALGASVKIKDRNVKDSQTNPVQAGKPGFIPAGQIVGGSSNSAGNEKDSAGLLLSGHSTTHAKPAGLKQSADVPSSPASLMDADGADETLPTSASSPVTAKLVQTMSQSEFRVGMQSQEFGNIDIRTSVARHMFSAQISVEHSDVAKSLTAQLPGLFHRLADQQVAVGNIVIHGQSLGTSSGLAQDAHRQSWQPQAHSADVGTMKLNAEPLLSGITDGINSAGRLDIRI